MLQQAAMTADGKKKRVVYLHHYETEDYDEDAINQNIQKLSNLDELNNGIENYWRVAIEI